MSISPRKSFWILLALQFSILICDAKCMSIVDTGKSNAEILISDKATKAEKYAASEMAKYLKSAANTDIKILNESGKASFKNIILIGNWKSDPEIKKLIDAKTIDLPENSDKTDAFIIKTLEYEGRNYLVLSGATERATLYAVYCFLERFLNIGFFWEADIIPPIRKDISVNDIDIKEIPSFNMRFYMQECPFVYSTIFWDIEDWKKELDWMGKKKLNALMVPYDNWNYCVKMSEIVKEAKARDIIPIFGGECTRFETVDKEFVKNNEDHKYVKMRWWKNEPYFCLHPEDPLFIEKGKETIRDLVKKYGKGNIYFFSPYGEQTMMDISDDEILKVRTSYAESIQKIIKEEDPEGIWMYWTWPFICPPWPESHVKDFVGKMSDENSFVCDSSQPEIKGDYHYKRFNHFYGKKWLLSFIHLYGGDDFLAGNLGGLVNDVKDVATDEKTKNLSGIYICPELIHYNTIYFDLLTDLSWNPAEVKLEDFTKKYVLRRYGKSSYNNMKKAMDSLLKSVYGGKDSSDALYQHRPLGGSDLKILDLLKIAKQVYVGNNSDNLKEALTWALKEKDKQKKNPCYQKDVVDILRQYISDIFNYHYLNITLMKNDAELRKNISGLRFLMDKQEELLAAYNPYQLKSKLKPRANIPKYKSLEYKTKNSTLTFAAMDWLIDYPSKDIYELNKFYYKPRMECYFDSLLNKDKNKENNLLEQYQKIEKAWLQLDILSIPDPAHFSGSPADKVAEIFSKINSRFKSTDREENPDKKKDFVYSCDKNVNMQEIIWKDSSSKKWTKEFFKNGVIKRENGTMTIEAAGNEGTVFGVDVDIPVKEYPILNFKMKSNGNQVVFWVEWTDAKGNKRRNRVWQETPSLKWRNIAINVEKVLSLIARPLNISRIQIENIPNCKSDWEYIRFGSLQKNEHKSAPATEPATYYPLNEGQKKTAKDLSKNKNDAQIMFPDWQKDGDKAFLRFDGKRSCVKAPHKDYLNFKDQFSITAWVYCSNPLGARGIASKGRGVYSGYNFSIINKKLALDCCLKNKGRKEQKRFFTNEVIEKNKWLNLGLVFDSSKSELKFYLDGKLLSTKHIQGSICYTPPLGDFDYEKLPLVISGLATFPDIHYQFDGYIREVRLYNQALSSSEIKSIYESERAIAQTNPQASIQKNLAENAATVRCKILDDKTKKPLTCKVFLKDAKGKYLAPPESFSFGNEKKMQFYAFENFEIKLEPGKYNAVFLKGFEYEPKELAFEITGEDDNKNLEIKLKRWVDLPALGWNCGDEELQTYGHTEKPYDLLLCGKNIGNALKIFQAEGLNWSNIVSGMPLKEKQLGPETLAGKGREVCSRMLGDVICIRTDPKTAGLFAQLKTFQIISGMKSAGTFSEPFTAVAQPVLKTGCRGLPVAVALEGCQLWRYAFCEKDPIGYRFLNLGFKMASSAGSDQYINNPSIIVSPGYYRAYTKVDKLDWDQVIDAYRKQKLFATYGPYAIIQINGKDMGETIEMPKEGGEIEISIKAGHLYGIKKLELIKNGKVIKEIVPPSENINFTSKFKLPVNETCWLALKCLGNQGKYFGNWAHTAPVYIQLGNMPMRPEAKEVKYFIKWMKDLKQAITLLAEKENWPPKEYKPYLSKVDLAIKVFSDLEKEPRKWK